MRRWSLPSFYLSWLKLPLKNCRSDKHNQHHTYSRPCPPQ
ncbi:hypothetical protein NC651_011741 [Populus alba x Populus x berolinensis]|nr:hypothetical protein NC651_011741 [Populus alba x Populus x berolinensis]